MVLLLFVRQELKEKDNAEIRKLEKKMNVVCFILWIHLSNYLINIQLIITVAMYFVILYFALV